MLKELFVKNAAVLHNDSGGCTCGNHDRTSMAVANQEDLLGLPSWDDFFKNPLAKEDQMVLNQPVEVESVRYVTPEEQAVLNSERWSANDNVSQDDLLGLPEYDFSKPWPGQSR